MDTRSKILDAGQARQQLQGKPVCWVSGHFDPLLAGHVLHLGQCASPGKLLAVEVTEPIRPILAQRARAELVAALQMVDYVVLSDKPPSDEAGPETAVTHALIQHVLRRHRQEQNR